MTRGATDGRRDNIICSVVLLIRNLSSVFLFIRTVSSVFLLIKTLSGLKLVVNIVQNDVDNRERYELAFVTRI